LSPWSRGWSSAESITCRRLHDGGRQSSGFGRITEGKNGCSCLMPAHLPLLCHHKRLLGRPKKPGNYRSCHVKPVHPCAPSAVIYQNQSIFISLYHAPETSWSTAPTSIHILHLELLPQPLPSSLASSEAFGIHSVCYKLRVSLPLPNSGLFALSLCRVTLDPQALYNSNNHLLVLACFLFPVI